MSNPLIFADQFGNPSSLTDTQLTQLLPAHDISSVRGIETEFTLRAWARANHYSRERLAKVLNRQKFPIGSADPRKMRKP